MTATRSTAWSCLEEILREFKAGTRDVAEGWEQKGEKVKRTRYFALRDHDGAYKGILEVNEDVTERPRAGGRRRPPRLVTRTRSEELTR